MKNERQQFPLAQQLGQALIAGAGENHSTKYSIVVEWKRTGAISQPHAYRILDGLRVPSVEIFNSYLETFEPTGDSHRRIASYYLMLMEDGAVALNDKSPSPLAKEHMHKSQQARRERERQEREMAELHQDNEYPIAS